MKQREDKRLDKRKTRREGRNLRSLEDGKRFEKEDSCEVRREKR